MVVTGHFLFTLSVRPNIFLGTCEGSTQYKKWYYEVMADHVESFVTAQATHLRVGWAMTEGYSPYPGGGEGWGGNGVGDDLYSYGFDGLHLWSGKNSSCYYYHGGSIIYCGIEAPPLQLAIQAPLPDRWHRLMHTPWLQMMLSAAAWI